MGDRSLLQGVDPDPGTEAGSPALQAARRLGEMLAFCPLSLFARNIWIGETAKAVKSIFASHFNQELSVLSTFKIRI